MPRELFGRNQIDSGRIQAYLSEKITFGTDGLG
jgi:hypothetical protein